MVSFKFSPDETPNQDIFNAIQSLNHFDNNQLTSFFNVTLALIKGDSQDDFASFSETNNISAKTLTNLMQNTVTMLMECFKLSLKSNEVTDDLVNLGMETDKAQHFAQLYQQKFASFSGTLIDSTFKASELIDIEWKFGVTAATSSLQEVGTCFLQLKLVLDRNDQRDNVVFELTLPQFYQFVASMQKAAVEIQRA